MNMHWQLFTMRSIVRIPHKWHKHLLPEKEVQSDKLTCMMEEVETEEEEGTMVILAGEKGIEFII